PLATIGADNGLVFGLEAVDGAEGLVGEMGRDGPLGVGEADEGPEQVGGFGEIVGVGDDLAGDPVEEDDLDRRGTPTQGIAGPVVAAEPQERVEQVAVVGVTESGGEPGGEEPPGESPALLVAPLWSLVAGSAVREEACHPLDQRPADGPGVSLERWEGHGAGGDGSKDPDLGVGRIDVAPRSVGIGVLALRVGHQVAERFGDDEGVLDDGPEVVVDVDDGAELFAGWEAGADHEVVAVAQEVGHLHRSRRLRSAGRGDPGREWVAPAFERPGDPAPFDLVAAQHADRRQQCRRLELLHFEERPDQLLAGRADQAIPLHGTHPPGIHHRQQRTGERQEAQWVVVAQRSADVRHQVVGIRFGAAVLVVRPEPSGLRPLRRHPTALGVACLPGHDAEPTDPARACRRPRSVDRRGAERALRGWRPMNHSGREPRRYCASPMIPSVPEDVVAILTAATPDELWRWLVLHPHLRAFPNPTDAVAALRRLHRGRPDGAVRTAGLLCTDHRWRRVTAPLIAAVEQSGLLADAELDELADGFLWSDQYRCPVPEVWIRDRTVTLDGPALPPGIPLHL